MENPSMRHAIFLIGISFLTVVMSACTAPSGDGTQGSSSSMSSVVSSDAVVSIHLSQPAPSSIVKSPLIVSGDAKGTWYFEASFPIRLLDAHGNEIVAAPAQA